MRGVFRIRIDKTEWVKESDIIAAGAWGFLSFEHLQGPGKTKAPGDSSINLRLAYKPEQFGC